MVTETIPDDAARLLGVIASALSAMDKGEYGAARQILRSGKDEPLKPITTVLTKVAG